MKSPRNAARQLDSIDGHDDGDGSPRSDTGRVSIRPAPGVAPFGGIRPPRRQAPAVAAPDLTNELEAALLSDLQSMVSLFDDATRADRKSAAHAEESAATDAEFERLIADMRERSRSPERPAARTATEAPAVVAPIEFDEAALRPAPRQPASPRPTPRESRRAASPAARPRPPANRNDGDSRRVSRAEPVPPLKIELPASRSYLKPAIAASALILIAAIGAGMTVRALTARSDAPATEASAASSALSETSAAATPAIAAPAASEPAAPVVRSVDATPAADAAPVVRSAVDTRSAEVAPATSPTLQPAADSAADKPPVDATLSTPAPAAAVSETPVATAPTDTASATPAPAAPAATDAAPVQPTPVASTDPAPVDAAPAPADAAAAKPVATAKAVPAAGRGLPAGPATVASGVNLRSNPDKGAPVIGQLKTGETVQVVSCNFWCEVVAGDKRGYVFQKFLAPAAGGNG